MFCDICGTPVMAVYTEQKGWEHVCIKCGKRSVPAVVPEYINKQAAKEANRGMSFYLTQKYDKAEKCFLMAAQAHPGEPQYLWAALLARYGVKYCPVMINHGSKLEHVINYWRDDIPDWILTQTQEYQTIEDEAAAVDYRYLTYYSEEAELIDKGLTQIGAAKEHYDVFLSFKDTDEDNDYEPTEESKLMEMIYPELVSKGVKPFYAKVSMAGKSVYDYEGYIHNAIRSSDMMVLLVSTPKNASAAWVESEWKRFLNWNQGNKERLLVCSVGNLSPSSLPPELRNYQIDLSAQDVNVYAANWFASEIRTRWKELKAKTEAESKNVVPPEKKAAAPDVPKAEIPVLWSKEPQKRQEKAIPASPVKEVPVQMKKEPIPERDERDEKAAMAAKRTKELLEYQQQKKAAVAQSAGVIRQIAVQKEETEKHTQVQEKKLQSGSWKTPEYATPGLTYVKNANGTLTITGCEDKTVTTLMIPESIGGRPVIAIGREAFQGCKALTMFSAEGITAIESRAFYGCSELRAAMLPGTLEKIDEFAFAGCGNLESISIPDLVEEIGQEAFSRCVSLSMVKLPLTLKRLGNMAFFGCRNLRKINKPALLGTVNPYVFSGCESLPLATLKAFMSEAEAMRLAAENKAAENKAAENKAAAEKQNGKPDAVSNLTYKKNPYGALIITGCKDKTVSAIIIPKLIDGQPVIAIGREAFQGCTALKMFSAARITSIESRAFYGCSALKTVILPETMKKIGEFAFASCGSLESISIPDKVYEIGQEAFSRCVNLSTVKLPLMLTALGNMAFFGCRNLRKINKPARLGTVNPYVFSGCESLPPATLKAFSSEAAQKKTLNEQKIKTLTKQPKNEPLLSKLASLFSKR